MGQVRSKRIHEHNRKREGGADDNAACEPGEVGRYFAQPERQPDSCEVEPGDGDEAEREQQ